jgi:hypothetical protein
VQKRVEIRISDFYLEYSNIAKIMGNVQRAAREKIFPAQVPCQGAGAEF